MRPYLAEGRCHCASPLQVGVGLTQMAATPRLRRPFCMAAAGRPCRMAPSVAEAMEAGFLAPSVEGARKREPLVAARNPVQRHERCHRGWHPLWPRLWRLVFSQHWTKIRPKCSPCRSSSCACTDTLRTTGF